MILRKGQLQDTESFIRLLQQVHADMPDKDWFFVDPGDHTRARMLDGSMELWIAEEDGRLAGALSVIYPGLEKSNLGYDLQLPSDQLDQVVLMDSAAVHPDFRGMGLQKALLSMAETELSRQPGRILLATVHPDNRYSLRNFQALGYTVAMRLNKYGSVRCILRKDLTNT